MPGDLTGPRLVVVTGWTGAGKSTIAGRLGAEPDATVASFDWVTSGLRALPEVWAQVENPVELQRQLAGTFRLGSRSNSSGGGRPACSISWLARNHFSEWRQLACDHAATLAVVESHLLRRRRAPCRVEGRQRRIPGWYELGWSHVERGRQFYEPLPDPKVVIDAVRSVDDNLAHVRQHLDRSLPIDRLMDRRRQHAPPDLTARIGAVDAAVRGHLEAT